MLVRLWEMVAILCLGMGHFLLWVAIFYQVYFPLFLVYVQYCAVIFLLFWLFLRPPLLRSLPFFWLILVTVDVNEMLRHTQLNDQRIVVPLVLLLALLVLFVGLLVFVPLFQLCAFVEQPLVDTHVSCVHVLLRLRPSFDLVPDFLHFLYLPDVSLSRPVALVHEPLAALLSQQIDPQLFELLGFWFMVLFEFQFQPLWLMLEALIHLLLVSNWLETLIHLLLVSNWLETLIHVLLVSKLV